MDLSALDNPDLSVFSHETLREFHDELEQMECIRRYGKFYDYFPDTGPLRRELYPKQLEFFRATRDNLEVLLMAGNRVGKALKNGTPVATPTGWRPIEALKVGDEVIAGDGSITRVIGHYPQGVKPLYRMCFDSGEIECCGEHLWKYQHPRARFPYRQSHGAKEVNPFQGEWSVGNTAEIIAAVGMEPKPRRRVVMPACEPWQLPETDTPIDPWLLGVLLGDGYTVVTTRFSTVDEEILDGISAVLPTGTTVRHYGGCGYAISSPAGRPNPILTAMRSINCMGRRSAQKRVPDAYLFGSIDTRLAVLQGLMDTDGYISATGAMEFSTVSPDLATDVQFLVQSLGGKSRIVKAKVGFRVKIRLNICPFRLSRKAARWNIRHRRDDHILQRIEPAGEGEATCIAVAHPDRTFVTAHGVVTHNTEAGCYAATCWLTGEYPHWWDGRRWDRPIRMWAAGDTNETTRDVIQKKLLGGVQWYGDKKGVDGTRMIPADWIDQSLITWKAGVPDLIDTVRIKHRLGGFSTLGLKAYAQGRRAFQGTEQDVIWTDEEPPEDVYNEMLIRLMTTKGLAILTFTPLNGWSKVVESFMPRELA